MSVNTALIVGRIGNLDLKYTPDQQAVLNFSVATKSAYKDKKTEKWIEQTEWHNIILWGKRAETIHQYASKGSWVSVEGSLQTSTWEDKATNKKMYKTEIKASKVDFYTDKKNPDQPRHTNEATPLPDSDVSQKGIDKMINDLF